MYINLRVNVSFLATKKGQVIPRRQCSVINSLARAPAGPGKEYVKITRFSLAGPY